MRTDYGRICAALRGIPQAEVPLWEAENRSLPDRFGPAGMLPARAGVFQVIEERAGDPGNFRKLLRARLPDYDIALLGLSEKVILDEEILKLSTIRKTMKMAM